jgi:glutathione synthase/RimK-type ligase-like ATP-grasp enzyme
MTEMAMLYDRSETDELGIRMTAEEMGVDLGFIPFHKVAFRFDTNGFDLRSLGKNFTEQLKDVRVVLNRTQSKSRRLYAANIFDVLGTDLINPLSVELTCQSKVRTLLSFARNGILVPKTVYVPSNVVEQLGGNTTQDYSAVISKMIHDSFDSEKVVLKPDAGTHGRGVGLFEGLNALQRNVQSITPSIINTAGVVAQEFIPKWFYDLRILVKKEKDEPPHCHKTALARGGFAEFRTNTFLGNMVFRAKLPQSVRREAEKCGEIIANGSEAYA